MLPRFITKVLGKKKDPRYIEVPCSTCPNVMQRRMWLPNATCEDCKVKRRRLYSRMYKSPDGKPRPYVYKNPRAMKKNRERELVMTEMRLEGKTLEQIAQSMTPVITRERVRQILYRISMREGIEFEKQYKRTGRPSEGILTRCRQPGCTEVIRCTRSTYKGEGRHACAAHKQKSRKYPQNSDGSTMSVKDRIKWRYHNDPEWRKKRIEVSKKWHYKELSKKGDYYKRYLKYQREYTRKKRIATKANPSS